MLTYYEKLTDVKRMGYLSMMLIIMYIAYSMLGQSTINEQIKEKKPATTMPERKMQAQFNPDDLKYAAILTKEQVDTINNMRLPTRTLPNISFNRKETLPAPTDLAKTPNLRCVYKQQAYVAGDMVKTKAGWMRCAGSLSFYNKGSNLTWVKVQ